MSKIPYRTIPISLETHDEWLKMSLKRRELFHFLCRECVNIESHTYKGRTLTFGQYVWSLNTLLDRFNDTLNPEDQYSRAGLRKALDFLCEIQFIKKEKFGSGAHSNTMITITYLDSYELIKKQQCPTNDEQCPHSAQSNEYDSAQSDNDKKPSQGISTKGNEKKGNTLSAQPIISLNNDPVPNQTEITETNNNDFVYERQCHDNAFSKKGFKAKDGVEAPQRYKLTMQQIESFEWLSSQKIDSTPDTLSWWAKTYSLKRLKDVHKAACKVKPKKGKKNSVGALMGSFLKKDTPVECDSVRDNAAFLPGFTCQYPEFIWKIEKAYVTCEYRNIKKEIPLKYAPNLFLETLLRTINNLKGEI